MMADKPNEPPAPPPAAGTAAKGKGKNSRVWDYIRANNLQKPTDKRVIVADETPRPPKT
jgi:hypothetical protein